MLFRCSVINCDNDGRLRLQKSGVSENTNLPLRSSFGSLESISDADNPVVNLHDAAEETAENGLQMLTETKKGYVNMNDCLKPNDFLQVVNNRELLLKENQLRFVNNNIDGVKVENLFESGGDEHD